jgi:exopolysaccharide biosynthesis polyprenyl glycosylphosphotransferase
MANATDGVADAAPLRPGRAQTREPASIVPKPLPVADDSPQSETLSEEQFEKQLRVEKRRADRIKSPLSLVLVRIEAKRGGGFATVDELLESLRRGNRETDIVGRVGKDRVGLLLPHTSEEGARACINGVAKRTAHLSVSIHSATYPDHLFDNLMSDARDVPDTLAFLLDEKAEFSPTVAWVKRGLDIVGALVALVILSPLMLVTALAIAATSRGPVIFRQMRLGKGAVPFVFYKFRSMRTDADDRIHREYVANLIQGNLDQVNQGDEQRPLYKMSADPRITPVGRIIRKTSLDELPQFFNVLKGDMSLVGPRPPLPYEAEKYQSWHLRRILQIRPGITGLWQVEGRSKTSFDDMVRLDLRYIRNCSLALDLKILLKTVKVVLRRDGAG